MFGNRPRQRYPQGGRRLEGNRMMSARCQHGWNPYLQAFCGSSISHRIKQINMWTHHGPFAVIVHVQTWVEELNNTELICILWPFIHLFYSISTVAMETFFLFLSSVLMVCVAGKCPNYSCTYTHVHTHVHTAIIASWLCEVVCEVCL